MAKTNRRPSDKFERQQRLAQRAPREDQDYFSGRDWLLGTGEEDNSYQPTDADFRCTDENRP